MERKIIHIDMDAFFAAIEQRDDPALQGKPVVVGGNPQGRGVVATASYEARKFGIHSALPSAVAYRLCPEAIFVRPRFEVYKAVSQEIQAIFSEVSDKVEALSLDEAYIDVTQNKLGIPIAKELAQLLKQRVKDTTGLTASAGVSVNKMVAKIASDYQKPDGLTVVRPDRVRQFLDPLPVRKIPGVGPVTEAKLHERGIFWLRELREISESKLTLWFGRFGAWLYYASRGEDGREVESERERKSVGAEDTFPSDLSDVLSMEQELNRLAERVSERLSKRNLAGRTITLKATFSDFEKITRSRTDVMPVAATSDLLSVALNLLHASEIPNRKVRLLGISVSNFGDDEEEIRGPVQLEFAWPS